MLRTLLALASVATPSADRLPHFGATDPIPPEVYREFRNRIILTGKCQAYEAAGTIDDKMKALDICFLDFIAPRS